jgi:1,4-alpha-glucan branching enzyme
MNATQKQFSVNRTQSKKANKSDPKKQQLFSFVAPGALSVQLVGDFTHWQEQPISMKKGTDGVWKTSVTLEPGVHHYRFLVDGQWRDDPECELRVANPFGGHNSMRKVD